MRKGRQVARAQVTEVVLQEVQVLDKEIPSAGPVSQQPTYVVEG